MELLRPGDEVGLARSGVEGLDHRAAEGKPEELEEVAVVPELADDFSGDEAGLGEGVLEEVVKGGRRVDFSAEGVVEERGVLGGVGQADLLAAADGAQADEEEVVGGLLVSEEGTGGDSLLVHLQSGNNYNLRGGFELILGKGEIDFQCGDQVPISDVRMFEHCSIVTEKQAVGEKAEGTNVEGL